MTRPMIFARAATRRTHARTARETCPLTLSLLRTLNVATRRLGLDICCDLFPCHRLHPVLNKPLPRHDDIKRQRREYQPQHGRCNSTTEYAGPDRSPALRP